jgi:hypothetical protein
MLRLPRKKGSTARRNRARLQLSINLRHSALQRRQSELHHLHQRLHDARGFDRVLFGDHRKQRLRHDLPGHCGCDGALSLPPPPFGVQPAPISMPGAVLTKHYSKTHARLAIPSLAQLVEADHLCLPRTLCLNWSVQPRNANQCTSDACSCKQRLEMHSVLLGC